MTNMRKTIYLALSILAAVSCVDINKGPESIYDKDVEILFKPDFQLWDSDTDVKEGTSAGLFVSLPGDGISSENFYRNTELTLGKDGQFVSDDALYYPKNSSRFDFILYSPHTEVEDGGFFSFGSSKDASGMLYSNNLRGKYKSFSPLKPIFRHIPARILLHLTAGTGISDSDLASAEIRLSDANLSGRFSLSDGTFTPDGDSGDILFEDAEGTKTCLAFPTPPGEQEKSFLSLTVGAMRFNVKLTGIAAFEYGRQYDFHAKVSVPGIEISLINISDWNVNDESGSAR